MRYYKCVINANSEKIRRNTKIRLNDYDYDSAVGAVNKYIYRNIRSNVHFISYSEEGNSLNAVFCYHEDKLTYKEACAAIAEAFQDASGINISRFNSEEITTYDYFECLNEARRRSLLTGYSNYLNETNDFVYYAIADTERFIKLGFTLEERLVPDNADICKCIYDNSLLDEISNIETNSKKMNFACNIMHYVVSYKGMEAASDITDKVLHSLMKANRLQSRRVETIHEITPEMYKKNDNLDNIIRGNFGGTVVLDLTEKFGGDPAEYGLNCQYIEKLVRKYKNDCLFVFTYNMNHPGFAYKLIPMIQKHLGLVKLKEASVSRDAALQYMKSMIRSSSCSKYVKQAEEFFEQFRGNKFSQTDVMDMFEKFEPWCMNRSMGNAYSFNEEDDFMLDRDADVTASSEKLNSLIGLLSVKEQIRKIIATNVIDHERRLRTDEPLPACSMHMVFGGNPGTAKTTVAKLFAGLAKECGILKSGIFIERGGMDYNAPDPAYVVRRDFDLAKGGVLFIDEAYALKSDTAITVLLQEMENRREEVIVILAGYNNRMKAFLDTNEGLKSRIPYWVEFPDYDTQELSEIFKLMIKERGFVVASDVLTRVNIILDKARLMDDFGNGRYVRNLMEKAIANQSERLYKKYSEPHNIPANELNLLTSDDFIDAEGGVVTAKEEGLAKIELEEMIGINQAKHIINKAIALYKMKKLYYDKGRSKDKPAMHMVFTGNPGTAKTTTARLFAEIIRDEKILPSGNFVEVGRGDLIGMHVGETAPLVKKRFRQAQGGVLFIDEAYSLCDGYTNSYGDEAINTIVQEMENHREDVIVIFAGYPKEMKQFLERNPGMASRIAFHVEFDDYTTDELCEIARLMLKKKELRITDEAMQKLRNQFDTARTQADYGNGRYVRKALEEAEMNLAERLYSLNVTDPDINLLTTIEACDIEDVKVKKELTKSSRVQIGFRAS